MSSLSLLLVANTGQRAPAQGVTVSFQVFYDNLSPYGQWVNDPQYGNVWVPNEEGDFRPYGTGGHWLMTEYGNTWISNEPWGWAPYHYGRWTYNPYYGWVWVPGYEWAPAWVSWRYGGGYSGWAPLGPGMSIEAGYNCPESWWVFVEPIYMYRADFYSHWRGPSYNTTYIRQTTVINNYYEDKGTHVRYNYGPHADAIQRDTHQPVQVFHVSQTDRAGAPSVSGDKVNIYRPAVDRTTANKARPANVMQAPKPIGKPQPATNAARQPAFRQDIQRQAPAQQPQRQAPAQQPQRQAPTQQPQHQAPAQQPQRQAPAQQPQHQAPTQQPQRQAPAQQPQHQAPAPQPQRQAPTPQPQRDAPAQQPQRQAPAPQPQRQAPAQQPQRQAPTPQPQRQAPAQQPQRQAPAPQPQRQAPAQQPQHQAPAQQPQRQAPASQPQRHEEGGRK
jgi:hypothetical protein